MKCIKAKSHFYLALKSNKLVWEDVSQFVSEVIGAVTRDLEWPKTDITNFFSQDSNRHLGFFETLLYVGFFLNF